MASPVTRDCALKCLGLSAHAHNRLTAPGACWPREPLRTVGDLLAVVEAGEIGNVRGIGQRRIGEIEVALVVAGFVIGHRHGRGAAAEDRAQAGGGCGEIP